MVLNKCLVPALQLTGPMRRQGLVSWALAEKLGTSLGERGPGGAEEEMPPVLAFASNLLLNKHISGLRVKYIELQKSGRAFRDQLLIFVQTFN